MKVVFAISGYDTPSVEVFLPNRNEWFEFKPLSMPRCNSSVIFVNNDSYMFIFAGTEVNSQKNLGSSFEKIYLKDFANFILENPSNIPLFKDYPHEFEKGSFIVDPYSVNLNFSGFGIIEKAKDSFYVFGGLSDDNETSENSATTTDEIKIFEYFSTENTKINKGFFKISNLWYNSSKVYLPKECSFYTSQFVTIDNNLVAQFTGNGNVLSYNKKKEEFTVILYDE